MLSSVLLWRNPTNAGFFPILFNCLCVFSVAKIKNEAEFRELNLPHRATKNGEMLG